MTMKMLRSTEQTAYVPDELIEQILSYSSVKSLLQLKCVSKAWRTLITDPAFTNLHLNRSLQRNNFSLLLYNSDHIYSIHDPTSTTSAAATEWPFPFKFELEDYDYYQVLGSCDGLLLLIPYERCLRIWNPSTGDFTNVPSPSIDHKNYIFEVGPWDEKIYGFGRGSKRSDYKIVSIRCSGPTEVKVFSTQSEPRTWRTIEGPSIHEVFEDLVYPDSSNGMFVRGAVHWVGVYVVGIDETTLKMEEEESIIVFDLGCEEFWKIVLPDHLKNNYCGRLSVWGDSLCLFVKDREEWASHIFVMKEYGVRDSWCKLYTIPEVVPIPEWRNPYRSNIRYWSIVCFTDDHKVLLQQEDLHNLVLYDTESRKFAELELPEELKNVFNVGSCYAYAYVPSLVQIKDNQVDHV